MNALLLTFGTRLDVHYQAIFAIASLRLDRSIQKIVVMTDSPEFYACCASDITLIPLSQAQLNEWKGAYDFFWRIKIKALAYAIEHDSHAHWLYIDSDVYRVADLKDCAEHLTQGFAFMHCKEGALSALKSKTEQAMWQILNGKTLADSVRIDPHQAMYNAGAIALPKDRAPEMVDLALKLCDAMCAIADCPRRLVEQFALSLAIAHCADMRTLEHELAHYWGNKKGWNAFIQESITQAYLRNMSLADYLLHYPPNLAQLPIMAKERKSKIRLQQLAERLFPDKDVRYFP